jgi:hypothetical protein
MGKINRKCVTIYEQIIYLRHLREIRRALEEEGAPKFWRGVAEHIE